MKKRLMVGLFICLIIINVSFFVSAEIIFSQPSQIYNLGENLEFSVEVNEIKEGFLELNLICNGNDKNIYNSILQAEKVDLNIPLTHTYIGELNGDCNIRAVYSGEESSSSDFKISKDIIVIVNLDRINLNPGEGMYIKGEATKENNAPVNGFVEAEISEKNIKSVGKVEDGIFNINFSIPSNIKGGEYAIIIKVYEKSGEDITNIGKTEKILNVKNEPSKIDISIDSQSINPGGELVFTPILYDQADYQLSGNMKVLIKDPSEEIFIEKNVASGEQVSIEIENDFVAGYWTIEANSLGVKGKRLFYVEENEKAEFILENATLIITNIGNVPYKKAIQILIGENIEIREVDLDLGESRRYRLVAPEGLYNIKVTDGTETLEFGEISLTGNVIGVQDIRKTVGALGRYPIVWLFLILVFGLFILLLVNKVAKRKFIGYKPSRIVEKDKKAAMTIPMEEGSAEHTLVLKGNKEEAGVLAVRTDKQTGFENIIRSKKGVIYKTGEFVLGIFTPSMTKTTNNEVLASKAALEIEKQIKDVDKDFGIGVNTGNIIMKKEGSGIRFTSLGSTINIAKKLATVAKNDVFVSEEVSKKGRNLIKTEKHQKDGQVVYKIMRIIDREINKKFVDDFLKKQKK